MAPEKCQSGTSEVPERHPNRKEPSKNRQGTGEPNDNGKKTCQPCIEVMCAKQRDRNRLARIAGAVLPRLQQSVRTGQGAYFSPSESLKLVRLLDA